MPSVKTRLAQRTTKQMLEASQSQGRLYTKNGKPKAEFDALCKVCLSLTSKV